MFSDDDEPEIIFKWTNSCRLCLSADSNIDLFSNDSSKDVLCKIRSSLNLLIYLGDPMPRKLCSNCLSKVNSWWEFRETCIQSENHLKKRLENYKKIEFVQEYFDKCAKFVSSEVVSSSSKQDFKVPITSQEEINSSGSQNVSEDDTSNCSSKTGSHSQETNSSVGKIRVSKDLFQSPPTDNVNPVKCEIALQVNLEETSFDKTADNFQHCTKSFQHEGDNVNVGTIASVTGSASALWDASFGEQSNFSKNPDSVRNDVHNIIHHEVNIKEEVSTTSCPDCGVEVLEEHFPFHNCYMMSNSSAHSENSPTDSSFFNEKTLDEISERVHLRESTDLDYQNYNDSTSSDGNSNAVTRTNGTKFRITPWKCSACRKYFKSSLELKNHFSTENCSSAYDMLHCEYCPRRYKTLSELLQHQIVHIRVNINLTEDDLICCRHCLYRCADKQRFDRHYVIHVKKARTKVLERHLTCPYCSKKYARRHVYDRHVLKHKKVINSKFRWILAKQNKDENKSSVQDAGGEDLKIVADDASEDVSVDKKPVPVRQSERSCKTTKPAKPSGTVGELSPNQVRCVRCGMFFPTFKDLEKHQLTKHKNPTPFYCRKCNLRFSARSQLLFHIRSHNKKKPLNPPPPENSYSCSACNSKFTSPADLESHLSTHLASPSTPKNPEDEGNPEPVNKPSNELIGRYRCSLCSKIYTTFAMGNKHLKYAHKDEAGLIDRLKKPILICRKSNLPIELKKVKFQCGKCPKFFFSKINLNLHQRLVHSADGKPNAVDNKKRHVRCKYCKGMFSRDYYKDHLRRLHARDAYEVKAVVDKVPDVKTDEEPEVKPAEEKVPEVESEVKPTNEVIRRFKCNYCPKMCVTPASRAQHEKIHYAEKKPQPVNPERFQCKVCNKRILSANSEIHMKTCKSVRCKKCNKIFFRYVTYKQHTCNSFTATEDLIKCTVCSISFPDANFLLLHMKQHHPTVDLDATPEPVKKEPPENPSLANEVVKEEKKYTKALWEEESNKIVCRLGEKFYCTYCDCDFLTIEECNVHKSVHPRGNWYAVQIDDTLFQCTICDKFFSSRKSSMLHINYHKKNSRAYAELQSKKKLKEAKSTEKKKGTEGKNKNVISTEKTFKCSLCKLNFDSESILKNHLEFVHVENVKQEPV